MFRTFPGIVSMVFGQSPPIVITALVSFILNLVLPKKSLKDEENERAQMEAGIMEDLT